MKNNGIDLLVILYLQNKYLCQAKVQRSQGKVQAKIHHRTSQELYILESEQNDGLGTILYHNLLTGILKRRGMILQHMWIMVSVKNANSKVRFVHILHTTVACNHAHHTETSIFWSKWQFLPKILQCLYQFDLNKSTTTDGKCSKDSKITTPIFYHFIQIRWSKIYLQNVYILMVKFFWG